MGIRGRGGGLGGGVWAGGGRIWGAGGGCEGGEGGGCVARLGTVGEISSKRLGSRRQPAIRFLRGKILAKLGSLANKW